MCGNAALCSTRLAAYLDIAPAGGMTLETDAGVYESRCAAEPDRAELHLASVAAPAQVPGCDSRRVNRRRLWVSSACPISSSWFRR